MTFIVIIFKDKIFFIFVGKVFEKSVCWCNILCVIMILDYFFLIENINFEFFFFGMVGLFLL